jgi:hypothetical protein
MPKYQVVYQGFEPDPNQVLTEPLDFETAHQIASELQAENVPSCPGESTKDYYVVEPIFSQGKL